VRSSALFDWRARSDGASVQALQAWLVVWVLRLWSFVCDDRRASDRIRSLDRSTHIEALELDAPVPSVPCILTTKGADARVNDSGCQHGMEIRAV
jgi:hypothetical protein